VSPIDRKTPLRWKSGDHKIAQDLSWRQFMFKAGTALRLAGYPDAADALGDDKASPVSSVVRLLWQEVFDLELEVTRLKRRVNSLEDQKPEPKVKPS